MSFNKVTIGGKFFPPEWFDFDRSEKPMENDHSERYEDILTKAIAERWEELPLKCPKCSNGAVIHEPIEIGETGEPEVWRCSCSWCDSIWFEHI